MLKNEFFKLLKEDKPDKDGTIKIRMGVSKYVKKDDILGGMNYLLNNLQKALKEFKNGYVVASISCFSDDVEAAIVFEAQILVNKQ